MSNLETVDTVTKDSSQMMFLLDTRTSSVAKDAK